MWRTMEGEADLTGAERAVNKKKIHCTEFSKN